MSIDLPVTHVMVSLREIPDTGHSNTLIRMTEADRSLVTDAATVAGLTQQKFMRAVLVSAARQVLKEAGIAV